MASQVAFAPCQGTVGVQLYPEEAEGMLRPCLATKANFKRFSLHFQTIAGNAGENWS
jgi:hypothetical protein